MVCPATSSWRLGLPNRDCEGAALHPLGTSSRLSVSPGRPRPRPYNQFPRQALKEKHGFETPAGFLDQLRLSSVRISASNSKADGQYIANTRKELAKLQSQLDDTNKQLADLKEFSDGKAPATSSGYEINKGYNRVPVNQQITNLEAKKKQLQDKIGALLDEARKKGVEPGDLR